MRGAAKVVKIMRLYNRISIHAPHAGSGPGNLKGMLRIWISIHAPHAGSGSLGRQFLRRCLYFNPRSPCGERRVFFHPYAARPLISIHAPHAGSGDIKDVAAEDVYRHFNPRSPCGERLSTDRKIAKLAEFQSTLPMRGAANPH